MAPCAICKLICSGRENRELKSIGVGEVHLWLLRDDLFCKEQLGCWVSALSNDEKEKAKQYLNKTAAFRYILTRVVLRFVLSHYVSIAPIEWRFGIGQYGRPFIENSNERIKLSFNISHTEGLVVIAVAEAEEVGVDVENVRHPAPIRIAKRFFSQSESDALLALEADRQSRRFYEIWTLKESYVKAIGIGLQMPLNEFAFDLGSQEHILFLPRIDDAISGDWKFGLVNVDNDFLIAICVRHAHAVFRMAALKINQDFSTTSMSVSFFRSSSIEKAGKCDFL